MIKTVHNLLSSLRDKGIQDIEPYLNIEHNPTIGSMYEGLTKSLMNKSIFDGLDLRVASGKISNSKGKLSKQIDCMIVIGEGDKIPFTQDSIYNVNKVIAVIEVKKNLYLSDLESAYDNLYSVIKVVEPTENMNTIMLRNSYKSIIGTEMPDYSEISRLPIQNRMIYHSLIIENYNPLRIIWGYEGFASEDSLRDKFLEFLNAHLIDKGYGVTSLPSLIICDNLTLIKTNGLPYAIASTKEGAWIVYASYDKSPILLLLEILWTKLCDKFELSSLQLFGDDREIEALNPLLMAQSDGIGWQYTKLKKDLYINRPISKNGVINWEPVEVSTVEFTILNLLCQGQRVLLSDNKLHEYIVNENGCIQDIIKHLSIERLIYIENNEIKLLTDNLQCVILPDGRLIAADNKDLRLTHWLNEFIKKRK